MIKKRLDRGFTIIEIIAVIVIIAILATITLVLYNGVQKKTRDNKRSVDVRIMASALEKYYAQNGEYPSGCNGGCYISSDFSPGDSHQFGSSTTTDTLHQILPNVSGNFGDPLGQPGYPFSITTRYRGYLYYGQYDLNWSGGEYTTVVGPTYNWISCGPGTPDSGFSLHGGDDPKSNTFILAYRAEADGKLYITQGKHGSRLTPNVAGTTVNNCIFLP